ncbi:hypothetical protein ABZ192_22025 [Streptomyces sp. NPDC006235]|uniref:hypothetical protein n=1 Tax=Streptomyces sp. NPDC006235 TaxID=3156736 RepID=UPI0033AB3FED
MHHTARTAPAAGGARPHVTFLAAVLLALLATLGIAGPPPGTTTEPVATAVAAVDRHAGSGPGTDDGCDTVCTNAPRADDGCDTLRAIRATTRPDPHSEHPAPRGHLATCIPGTDVTPPVAPHLPAPAAHLPSSDPHALRDRGRAPPVSSGI